MATITIDKGKTLAIHVCSKVGNACDQPVVGSTTRAPTRPPPTGPTPKPDWRRTVIFIKKQTSPGEDLFVRGGVDHIRFPGTFPKFSISDI